MEEIKYKDVTLIPTENILKNHRDLIPIQERLKVLENPLLDKKVVQLRKERLQLHEKDIAELRAMKLPEEDIELAVENQSAIFKSEYEAIITDYQKSVEDDKDFMKKMGKTLLKNFDEVEQFIDVEDFDAMEFVGSVMKCYAFFFKNLNLKTLK